MSGRYRGVAVATGVPGWGGNMPGFGPGRD